MTVAMMFEDAHAMQSAASHGASWKARPLSFLFSLPHKCCFLSLCHQAGCAEPSPTSSDRLLSRCGSGLVSSDLRGTFLDVAAARHPQSCSRYSECPFQAV